MDMPLDWKQSKNFDGISKNTHTINKSKKLQQELDEWYEKQHANDKD